MDMMALPPHRNGNARAFLVASFAAFLTASCGLPDVEMAAPVRAAADITTSIYLIGDAGAPDPDGEPVFRALALDVAEQDSTPLIVFLGDNVYPSGMPAVGEEQRGDAERRLRAQIDVVRETDARAIFIPGNHDWDFAGEGRRESIVEAAKFGTSIGGERVRFLPEGGCPGPSTVDLDTGIRLIFLDTQWWLFPDGLEEVPATCPTRSREAVLDALRSALASAGGRRVIVAGHHPLASGGPHGGHFTLENHIFPLRELKSWAWLPLPILGSAYPIARMLGVSDQDLAGPRNRRMRYALEATLRGRPPIVYAAGHEHGLQIMAGIGASFHVVSGGGNYGHVSHIERRDAAFAASAAGYVRLQFQRDGQVRLGVIVVDREGGRTEAYSAWLEPAEPARRHPEPASPIAR